MPIDADTAGARPEVVTSTIAGRGAASGGPAGLLRSLLTQAAAPPLMVALAALNHVIRQQGWARQRLRPFAGRSVRLALDGDTAPARWLPPLVVRIDDDGTLRRAVETSSAQSASVTLWLRPSADLIGAWVAADREQRLAAHLRIEGDVMLATALGELARHLRWDVEDDLGQWIGDVPAHRVGRGARVLREKAQRLVHRGSDSALQFVTTEQPLLVPGARLRDRAVELDELAQRIDRLSVRVDRLSS